MNDFVKAHGLGNSYIILEERNIDFALEKAMIQKICSEDHGIGSDGILLLVNSDKADFGLRIFNPDGSEAEKSGNGVRIFGKYLYDNQYTEQKHFTLDTLGGEVGIEILQEEHGKATLLKAAMGQAVFNSKAIPASIEKEEVLDEPLVLGDQAFLINLVSMGNPHCVIFVDDLDEEMIRQFGPLIEKHPLFPARINVQFAKLLSPNEVDILIWERGAGYTLASGSSSCAVAAIGHKKGLLSREVLLNMPGGQLEVIIHDDWQLDLIGPVEEVCQGRLSSSFIR